MLAVAEEMAAEEVEEGKIRFLFLHIPDSSSPIRVFASSNFHQNTTFT